MIKNKNIFNIVISVVVSIWLSGCSLLHPEPEIVYAKKNQYKNEIKKPFINKSHTNNIKSVVISSDGKFIVSGAGSGIFDSVLNADNTIKLWDLKNNKLIKTFVGHSDDVECVAISKDNKFIVSGSHDKTIKVWDTQSGNLIKTLKGHDSLVLSIAISKNNRFIISGSYDESIKIWDIKEDKLIKTLDGHNGPINSVAVSGDYIVSGDDKTIQLWSLQTGKLIKSYGFGVEGRHKSDIKSVAINGDYIVSGSHDGTIKIWSIKTGKLIKTFQNSTAGIISVSISKDGKFIVSGDTNCKVKIWSFHNGKVLKTFNGHNNWINSVAISPDNKFIISASEDRTMKKWNVNSGELIENFKQPMPIVSVDISIDDRFILFNKGYKSAKLFEIKNGKFIKLFKDYKKFFQLNSKSKKQQFYIERTEYNAYKLYEDIGAGVWRGVGLNEELLFEILKLSKDNKFIVSVSYGNKNHSNVNLWDTKNKKLIKTFKNVMDDEISSMAISSDNKYIVLGGDKVIKLISFNDGKVIKTYNISDSLISSIGISNDNKFLVASSIDSGITKILNTETGKELVTLTRFDDNEWIIITPDGYFNASKNGAKYLNILTGPMEVSSIDQFYDKFYRPDIVKAALQGTKIDTGLKISDVKPAPKIEIVKTPSKVNKDEVSITLKIKEQRGGGVGDIRLFLNGVSVKTDNDRALKRKKDDAIYKTYTLKLINGENTIKAIVFNKENSMQSRDVIHTITANFKSIYKPTLHALILGINEFKNPKLTLNYASSDAELFASTLKQSSKELFEKLNITTLNIKSNTTKQNIIDTIKSYKNINPNDLFVFYVASHGTVDDGEYYLITSNVGSTSTRKLIKDAISQTELKNLLANVPTTKKMIVFDTCNAGKMGDSLQMAMMTRGMSEDTAMKVLSRAVGSTILSAANSQQEAMEGYKNHGLFTYVLSQGLKGKADFDNDGFVKTRELSNYVEDEVPELAEKVFNRAQYPVISPTGTGFPIGINTLK